MLLILYNTRNKSTKEQLEVKVKEHFNAEASTLNRTHLPDFKSNESIIKTLDKKDNHHLYDYVSPIEHEPKKILTKPALIRLRCKTRYNDSKIVINTIHNFPLNK